MCTREDSFFTRKLQQTTRLKKPKETVPGRRRESIVADDAPTTAACFKHRLGLASFNDQALFHREGLLVVFGH